MPRQAKVYKNNSGYNYAEYRCPEMETSVFCVDTAFLIAQELIHTPGVLGVEVHSWPNNIIVGRFLKDNPTTNIAPPFDRRGAYGRGHFDLSEYDLKKIEQTLYEIGVPKYIIEGSIKDGKTKWVEKPLKERLEWIVGKIQTMEIEND